MPEPLPDPKLRRALEQVDALKRDLRAEKIRSGNLRHTLQQVQQGLAQDSKPAPRPERRAGC